MNLRWLMGDPIDPDLPLKTGERFVVLQDAKLDATFDRRLWAWTGAILAMFLAVFAPGCWLAVHGHAVIGGALIALSMVIIFAAGAATGRQLYAPYAWRVLRRRGYDVCLGCGYWLRGLGDDVAKCPECGAERETAQPQPDVEHNT